MESAGTISTAFFLWVQPLIRAGYWKPLQIDDAMPLAERLRPNVVFARFEALWAAEKERAAARAFKGAPRKGPSINRVLWQLTKWDVCRAVVLQIGGVVFAKFAAVLLLRRLTQIVAEANDDLQGEGLAVAFGLFAVNVIDGLVSSLATFSLQRALYAASGCITQSVLQKGRSLHPAVQDKFRRGDLVTLGLSDLARVVDMSAILMQGIGAPFMLLTALVVLLVLVGPMALFDIIVIIVMGFIIARIGLKQGTDFRQKMRWQGTRLSVLNEMLQSVRFTKYYALEDHYEKQMIHHRKDEEKALFGMKVSMAVNWPAASLVPTLTVALILPLHILFHGALPSTSDTLAILAVARFLYLPFAFFGGFLGSLNMFRSATSRWATLMQQSEIQWCTLEPPSSLAICIKGCSFSWGLGQDLAPTLKSLNIAMPQGQLWAIVGELGSGKSSVLAATLGCMSSVDSNEDASSFVTSGTSRAYVGQVPMVMNATVRENVFFGSSDVATDSKDEARYQAALEAAALLPDLAVLPAGDLTEIGEKGITLSGGQKARVALARAVFASRPGGLVLLDDPLSAVDAHVGSHIFNECIVGALAGTTRLLVTNQLHFLQHEAVSKVLVMHEGRVTEEGTFAELSANPDSRLSKLAASLGGAMKDKSSAADGGTEGSPDGPAPSSKTDSTAASLPTTAISQLGAPAGKLVKAEAKTDGVVSWKTPFFYFSALGGFPVFLFLFFISWFFHLGEVAPDMFLVAWQDDAFDQATNWYLTVWLVLTLGGFIILMFSRITWAVITTWGAGRLHNNMMKRVLHCPMSFYDQTPSGRIMNRLGEDQMQADFSTSLYLEVLAITVWQVVDQVSIAMAAHYWVAPVVVVAILLFLPVREAHRRVNREIVRWWMLTKSPVFNIFEEYLSGVTTIHAFRQERFFEKRFEAALERNLEWLMTRDSTNLWTEQRLTLLGSLVVGALAIEMVLIPGKSSTALAGTALIYALQLGFSLKTASFFTVQSEGVMASIERIAEFSGLNQEPPWQMPSDSALVEAGWPGTGPTLQFEAVSVRYLSGGPLALNKLSVAIQAKEKVGIVGRTGSGKSTIMGAIFRLFELEEGKILFGDQDIAGIGIGLLRRQVTIVPQDPILFAGHIRKNLDPLGARSDDEVWTGLRRCHFEESIRGLDGGLLFQVSEGGSNFSVGERQVLCLARALLRDAQVLCLDEATANIDPTNEKRIQEVLTQELVNYMVLTIAHRLHTVLKSDRIIVLDAGRLAQLGTPKELLETPGILKDLAAQAGISAETLQEAKTEMDIDTGNSAPDAAVTVTDAATGG